MPRPGRWSFSTVSAIRPFRRLDQLAGLRPGCHRGGAGDPGAERDERPRRPCRDDRDGKRCTPGLRCQCFPGEPGFAGSQAAPRRGYWQRAVQPVPRAARGDRFTPITSETRGAADRPAPYEEASLRGFWRTEVSTDLDLQVSGSAFTDRRERGLAFTGNKTRGVDGSVRFVGSHRWPWQATAYVQSRDFASSFASVDEARASAVRVALQDDVHPQLGTEASRCGRRWAVGSNCGRAPIRALPVESRANSIPMSKATRREGGSREARPRLPEFFAELSGKFRSATLKCRCELDHWRISEGILQERLISTGEALRDKAYPDRSGWLPTARAAAVLDLGEEVSIRSAAYVGWRMPTLNELFRPFRAGPDATAANPSLDPERLTGIDTGVDYRSDGTTISLTAFANRLSNAIANVTLAEGPGIFPGSDLSGREDSFASAGTSILSPYRASSSPLNFGTGSGRSAALQAWRGRGTTRMPKLPHLMGCGRRRHHPSP